MIAHVGMRLCRRAVVNLWRAPLPSLVAVVTTALALLLAVVFTFGAAAARKLLSGWGGDATVTVYLDRAATDADARALAGTVRTAHPGLTVVAVERAQALQRLRAELGGLGNALDGLPQNPLPASLEITPPRPLSGVELRVLAAGLRELPGVADVDFGREWLDKLEALGNGVRLFGAGGLAVVLAAALLVVANTIRLAVYARRDEIEIMKLVGATDAYVRAPFLLEGALQGFCGAALALSAAAAAQRFVLPRVTQAFAFAAGGLAPRLVASDGALLLAVGTVVGFLGSWLAVSRFLKA